VFFFSLILFSIFETNLELQTLATCTKEVKDLSTASALEQQKKLRDEFLATPNLLFRTYPVVSSHSELLPVDCELLDARTGMNLGDLEIRIYWEELARGSGTVKACFGKNGPCEKKDLYFFLLGFFHDQWRVFTRSLTFRSDLHLGNFLYVIGEWLTFVWSDFGSSTVRSNTTNPMGQFDRAVDTVMEFFLDKYGADAEVKADLQDIWNYHKQLFASGTPLLEYFEKMTSFVSSIIGRHPEILREILVQTGPLGELADLQFQQLNNTIITLTKKIEQQNDKLEQQSNKIEQQNNKIEQQNNKISDLENKMNNFLDS